jgi:hypothetical protein
MPASLSFQFSSSSRWLVPDGTAKVKSILAVCFRREKWAVVGVSLYQIAKC